MATPMFIVTGFLDSGKTTMIKDTLMEQEWIEPGLTLLLLCEEGEEEYPEEYLKEKNMAVLKIEEFDQLNTVFFKNCERNYHPAQIIIEYNGMWKLEDLLSIRYPRSFELQGVYSLSLIHILSGKECITQIRSKSETGGDAVISDFIVFIQQHSGICDDNIVLDHYY